MVDTCIGKVYSCPDYLETVILSQHSEQVTVTIDPSASALGVNATIGSYTRQTSKVLDGCLHLAPRRESDEKDKTRFVIRWSVNFLRVLSSSTNLNFLEL